MMQTEKATIIKAMAAAAIKTLTIDIRNPAKIRATEKKRVIKAKKAIVIRAIKITIRLKITRKRAIILKGIKGQENLLSKP